jgi:O-methyltransferase
MKLIKNASKAILRPFREAAGRFVLLPRVDEEHFKATIIYKAAQIITAELVQGDYLEFGVFRGGSFVNAFQTLKRVHEENSADAGHYRNADYCGKVRAAWEGTRFFAFDSFAGLPETRGLDIHSNDFTGGKFSCSVEDFTRNLRGHSCDLDKVVIVPGWFDDTCCDGTLEKHALRRASIIHIDCDLYESAKVVLKFISPLLVDGTVIIFDDWYCFRGDPRFGEQRAFAEWTETMPEWIFTQYQKEGPWRNSFIVNHRGQREQPPKI